MMRGITFKDPITLESYHTGVNWDLVMSSKVIGTPPLKKKIISLPDRDGDVDYTDALRGIPSYGTRTLEFVFEWMGNLIEWTPFFAIVRNFIHGKRLIIIEPDDDRYYYMGRCEVSDPDGGIVKKFKISVTADTWKYKNGGETVRTESIEAGSTITLYNDWRPVVPSIVVSGQAEIRVGTETFNLSGGTFKIPEIVLTHGANEINVVNGSGSITFKYQEGAL